MLPATVLGLLMASLTATAPAEPILVAAAISLTDALQEIRAAYERGGGGQVRFTFAGSNALARQIVNGAPVDVFISADEAQMDHAQARGAIDPRSRFDLLTNRLVVVTAPGRGRAIPNGAALVNAERIAIGDPVAVPAGVYAKRFLERAGLWEQLKDRMIPLANVRAALRAVESGGVDAAVVYESDAAATSRAEVAFVVTGAAAPRIVYPAAIIPRTRHRAEAEKFLAFLRGSEARAIFRKYRFS